MNKGTVKWFNAIRGYGFITDSNGTDVFVHYSSIQMDGFRTLFVGDIVSYEVGDGTNGKKQAVNVRPIVTRKIVAHELSKKDYHLMRIKEGTSVHGWYIADASDNPVVDKEMDLVELAAYADIDVEALK